MTAVHIYTVPSQPLTHYFDRCTEREMEFRHGDREVFLCHDCGRRRWAKNLRVQVFYDMLHIFCAEREYGRSREFPFAYQHVCKGTGWHPSSKDSGRG